MLYVSTYNFDNVVNLWEKCVFSILDNHRPVNCLTGDSCWQFDKLTTLCNIVCLYFLFVVNYDNKGDNMSSSG